MELTISNINTVVDRYLDSKWIDTSAESTILNNGDIRTLLSFEFDGSYIGYAEIFFQPNVVLIMNHSISEEHQGKGTYVLLCRGLPKIAREFEYKSIRIAAPKNENADLQRLHKSTGFVRKTDTYMELDVTKNPSGAEIYAEGK
jgi:predicted GNAT family N-acyltransferase